MRPRTVILSDLHLGRPRLSARSARALRPLWKGAAQLIVNGDAAEVHHPRWWADAAREVLALHDLTERDDCALTLLSGNHDALLTDTRHLLLCDDQILVTHGDVLHPAVAPWSIRARTMKRVHELVLARAAIDDDRDALAARLTAAQYASHAEWNDLSEQAAHATVLEMLKRPWSLAQVLHYWLRFPRMAAEFADQLVPRASFIIMGHTHHPGLWKRGSRTIINTGCFGFPGRPYGIIIEGNSLHFQRIAWREDAWHFAPAPRASFQLAKSAEHQSPIAVDVASVTGDEAHEAVA